MSTRQEQKRKQKKREEERRKKKEERRKKDTTQGMPFIIAYQGDPARKFRCGQSESLRNYYELINACPENIGRNVGVLQKFNLLNKYKSHPVLDAGIKNHTMGILYIKDAP